MEPGEPIAELAREAAKRRCRDLWRDATHTVFGEGPEHAALVLIGEQPGDREDLSGRPFVGPAGRVLDAAPLEAGIVRDEVYVTNAIVTIHPSWLSRMPDEAAKARERSRFVADLRVALDLTR